MNTVKVDTTKAAVFCVVFIGMVTLIALGKIDPEQLKLLLFWLVPSPIRAGSDSLSTGPSEGGQS